MPPMKCHYEVLGIERDASDSDIKKSYRKLALQWHPDKNPERLEECTRTFHLIQQAYEVLIDPQERAWYDRHREAILRGGQGRGGDYEDKSLDVFQYFTASCYSGYNDGEKGFYTVYRGVFETIATEDQEFMDDPDTDEFPNFGDSLSTYEEAVGPFYGYWESYCTQRSYVWAEKYDTREAPNRQVRRAIETENRKLRDKARKERNEEVRELVHFVKKRDKRVQAYRKKLEERAEEIHRKTAARKEQHKLQRLEKLATYQESGWSASHNMESDLEALEAQLAQQFSDSHLSSDDTGSDVSGEGSGDNEEEAEEEEYDDLYCVACSKPFKTDKAMMNHEKSKKHREKVALLREQLEEEEEQLNASDTGGASDEGSARSGGEEETYVLYDELHCLACEKDFLNLEGLEGHLASRKHRMRVCELTGEPFVEETAPSTDTDKQTTDNQQVDETGSAKTPAKATSKKQKKRRRRKADATDEEEQDDTAEQDTSSSTNTAPVTSRLSAPAKEVHIVQSEARAESPEQARDDLESDMQSRDTVDLICNTCSKKFNTRNKLFSHLKSSGHALRIEPGDSQGAQGKAGKKKKGKR